MRLICVLLAVAFTVACGRGPDGDRQRQLATGAINGDLQMMKSALASGADVNGEWMLNSPLAWAVEHNHVGAVTLLLEKGANVNAHFGLPNRTALQQAAEAGHVEIVSTLIDAGAEVNARNKFGRTALYHAKHRSRQDTETTERVIALLVSKGATE
jgi:ankyrin repeat protein